MTFKYQEQVGGFVTELAYTAQKTSTIVPNDTLNDTVNKDRLSQILAIIQLNNKASIMRMSKDLGVSRITIIRGIDKLKELGHISRVGSDKAGHWEILSHER